MHKCSVMMILKVTNVLLLSLSYMLEIYTLGLSQKPGGSRRDSMEPRGSLYTAQPPSGVSHWFNQNEVIL